MSDSETLVDMLRHRAERAEERAAYTFLRDGDQDEATVSYGALDRQARALAVRLRELAAPGSRVLLLLPPGLQYITSFFGCLYAGMVAVPGYLPRGPEQRRSLRAMCRDAAAAVVVAESWRACADVFGDREQPACLELSVLPEVSTVHHGWRPPDLTADSISHLQYTSGTTRAPRAAVLTHGDVIWQLRTLAQLDVCPRHRLVSWLPPNHDMGLFMGILVPMYQGSPATLMSPLAFVERPGRWPAAISRYRADVSVAPNFGYELTVAKTTAAQREQWDLSCWAVALNGAEPVHPDTLRRFAEAFAPCGLRREALTPGYGLAEATLMVSITRPGDRPPVQIFDAAALRAGRAVPVRDAMRAGVHALSSCGLPAPGFQVRIVDPVSRRPCPSGAVGEIWLRGPSIAAGYWRRQRLTVRTFRARPVGTRETGFLRTGDLGFCHDGELFVVGRCKDVVIVHGENHHPHDLERTAERAHPACRRGGCAAFSSSLDGRERVVVVQEVRHDAPPLEIAGRIRRALVAGCGLDVHTVALVPPNTVPKSTSGKTRRTACRAAFETGALPILARHDCGWERPEPPNASSDSVAYLRQQVAALLGIPQAEVDEQAPLLQLTSLMAAALANRVSRDFGVELPVVAFLDGRDIVALAQMMSRRPAADTAAARRRSRSRQASGKPVDPCSAAQQRIWFQEQVIPGTPGYNVPVTLRLDGPLDIDALGRCVQEIVHRHEALRTCFVEVDGQPVPVVAPWLTVPVPVRDLAATSTGGAVDVLSTEQAALVEQLALRFVQEAATAPFDLAHGPLLRAQVIRLAPQNHLFALVVHHIVCDGWSVRLFLRELAELYRAFRQRAPSPLPALPLQYADFARDQQRRLTGGVLRSELRYWRGVLADAPATSTLAPDRPGPPSIAFAGLRLPFTLPAQLCASLWTLAEKRHSTPFMVLATGLVALLRHWTDQDDLVIGVPVANRSRVEMEDLIGMFVNTLPLRVRAAGDPSFGRLLQRVRKATLATLTHQELPFDRLVADLLQRREPGRNPLFQVLLAVQDIPITVPDIPGLTVSSVSFDGTSGFDLPLCTAMLDLTICLSRDGEGLTGHVEFNSARYRTDTVRLLLDRYVQLLHQVVSAPDRPLSDLLVEPTGPPATVHATAPIDMALQALRLAHSGRLKRR